MEICPLGTPARERTAESFIVIAAVPDKPNSTFTLLSDIAPDAGKAIYFFLH
jgi:hypothetical protein